MRVPYGFGVRFDRVNPQRFCLMFNVAWPWFLILLPAPWFVRRYLAPVRAADRSSLRLPFFGVVEAWEQDTSTPAVRKLRATLLYVIWVALVLGAARPQWIGQPLSMPVTGRDIFLAIDLSGSMDTQDQVLDGEVVDRLAAVKKVAGSFIDRRVGDRIGLILFGTRPYVQVPLTFDRALAQELLEDATLGLAGNQTAIGDAIGLAVSELRARPAQSRVVVMLTDGENTAGKIQPREAAQLAAFYGVRVYTIGLVGATPKPGDVQAEVDRIDEEALQSIARTTGGAYLRARDADGLEAVYGLLDDMEPAGDHDDIVRPTEELFYLPLGFGYGLAMLMITVVLLLSFIPREYVIRAVEKVKSIREPLPADLHDG